MLTLCWHPLSSYVHICTSSSLFLPLFDQHSFLSPYLPSLPSLLSSQCVRSYFYFLSTNFQLPLIHSYLTVFTLVVPYYTHQTVSQYFELYNMTSLLYSFTPLVSLHFVNKQFILLFTYFSIPQSLLWFLMWILKPSTFLVTTIRFKFIAGYLVFVFTCGRP